MPFCSWDHTARFWNPRRSNPPVPQITLGLRVIDRALSSFTGPELHGYEIDSADTLPPVWQLLTTDTNLSTTTILPVNTATNPPVRFYRVRLLD